MQSRPIRLQLRRTKGSRLQEDSFRANGLPAIIVDRGSIFGNPFATELFGRAGAVDTFKRLIAANLSDEEMRNLSRLVGRKIASLQAIRENIRGRIELLRGKNLACWCKLDHPCHADVLLEFANAETEQFPIPDRSDFVRELEKENSRLRQLITDMALTKAARRSQ